MTPDACLLIRFQTPDEGGRKTAITGPFYGCPLLLDGDGFECRLLIEGVTLELGKWYEVPVKFMNKDLVLPKLYRGKPVTLWEGRDIGAGEVLKIIGT